MTLRRSMAMLAFLAIVGCQEPPRPIAPVADSGELVVLTVNGPATYFEDAQGLPSGFEHDLVVLFAQELKVPVRFMLAEHSGAIEPMLREGRAHLAAAAIARHFDFPGGLAWGPAYFSTQHQVVGRTSAAKPKTLRDIAGKRLGVVEEAEYLIATPTRVVDKVERLPGGTSTADLLRMLQSGKLDFALVESNRFTLARRFFPGVDVAFNVGKPVEYAWLFSTVDKKHLLAAAEPFFERIRKDGTLKRLVDRHYGHAARITAIDSGTLLERIRTHLPALKPYFLEAEAASGIDWRLIAAIGYQESHWDASATSPTGVRGLMMLTEETASRLQVKNRLDARDSILGGARYFALLKEALAPRIAEPDRTYLALAAYNMGIGHLEDARILAQRAKLNPDKWQDVRHVLPRMSEPEAFNTLKHGYARGFEAMQLVDNVRNYYDILTQVEPREGAQLSTKGTVPGK